MNLQSAATSYVFEPAAVAALPVAGTRQLFPVHRIYCVGRNYAAHAVEMGHDPNKEPPFFFQKNPDNIVLVRRISLSVRLQRRASRDRDGGGAEERRHATFPSTRRSTASSATASAST